jgi:hypothetical protein
MTRQTPATRKRRDVSFVAPHRRAKAMVNHMPLGCDHVVATHPFADRYDIFVDSLWRDVGD